MDSLTADQIEAMFAAMDLATDADRGRFRMEFAPRLPDEDGSVEKLFLRTDEHTASAPSDPNA